MSTLAAVYYLSLLYATDLSRYYVNCRNGAEYGLCLLIPRVPLLVKEYRVTPCIHNIKVDKETITCYRFIHNERMFQFILLTLFFAPASLTCSKQFKGMSIN